MKTIVIALFFVLTVSLCFGGIARKMIVRYDGDITRIVGQFSRGPWVVFYRDLALKDSKADRVELRMWREGVGFSLPVMVFVDNDLDGKCDGVYACDLDNMTVGDVWASTEMTLYLSGTDAVGQDMREVHPLLVSVEPMEGC